MKDVNIFIAEPGKKEAVTAVSALARAMKEMNKVAIVRCVWRQGQAGVAIGVLTPNVSVKENIVSVPFQFHCYIHLPAYSALYFMHPYFTFLSSYLPHLYVCFCLCCARSLIHCTSIYFRLLRMFESSNFLLSKISLQHFNQLKNSRRLLII